MHCVLAVTAIPGDHLTEHMIFAPTEKKKKNGTILNLDDLEKEKVGEFIASRHYEIMQQVSLGTLDSDVQRKYGDNWYLEKLPLCEHLRHFANEKEEQWPSGLWQNQ